MYFLYSKVSINKSALVLIFPFLLFFLYCFISSYYYFNSIFKALFAVQPFILCILTYFFFASINFNYNGLYILKILKFVFILQVLFCLIKIVTVGVNESILLGTMSQGAGQLSFLFPCICIPYIVYKYSSRNFTLILLIFSLFLIGIAGEKRAVVFVFPILIFFCLLYFVFSKKRKNKLFNFFILGSVVSVLTVGGVLLIPSLSSEGGAGGTFSFSFITQYAYEYLFMDYGGPLQGTYQQAFSDTTVQVGRLTLWIFIIKFLINSDLSIVFFGFGHGSLTPSSWLNESKDLFFTNIGTRGAFTGANQTLLETGIVGICLIIFFFIIIFIKVYSLTKNGSRSFKNIVFVLLIINCICLFDFFFYSSLLFKTLPMPLVFFGCLALLSRMNETKRFHNLYYNEI